MSGRPELLPGDIASDGLACRFCGMRVGVIHGRVLAHGTMGACSGSNQPARITLGPAAIRQGRTQ